VSIYVGSDGRGVWRFTRVVRKRPPVCIPVRLAVRIQPGRGTPRIPFARQPVIELLDASRIRCPGLRALVTAAVASGSGTLIGTTTVNAVDGIATFTDLAILGTGPHTLTFSSPGLTSVTTTLVTVAPSSRSPGH
jgi:hypothetical protein